MKNSLLKHNIQLITKYQIIKSRTRPDGKSSKTTLHLSPGATNTVVVDFELLVRVCLLACCLPFIFDVIGLGLLDDEGDLSLWSTVLLPVVGLECKLCNAEETGLDCLSAGVSSPSLLPVDATEATVNRLIAVIMRAVAARDTLRLACN